MNKLLVAAVAGILLSSASLVAAQTQVSFPSLATEKPVVLTAYLYTPEGSGPFPAVVLAHTCGGIGQNVKDWARFLQTRGYLALVPDAFTARSIPEICTAPRLSAADRVGDAFGALKYLQSLSNVDMYRIGIMGYASVLPTVSETAGSQLPSRPNFAAATALYPDCLTNEVDSAVPLLIQSGERDDWSVAIHCQMKAARRKSEGYPVEINVYEGARHAYDLPGTEYHYGASRMNYNKPKFCCGATIGYNSAAHKKAEHATEAFFALHLKSAEPASKRVWSPKPSATRDEVAQLVKEAKAYVAANGREKLIQLIDSQDAQFRKRRQYLALFDQNGTCLAHGMIPVGLKDSDFLSRIEDDTNRPTIDVIRSALKNNPPWGSLSNGRIGNSDIYVESLDKDVIVVGFLMK